MNFNKDIIVMISFITVYISIDFFDLDVLFHHKVMITCLLSIVLPYILKKFGKYDVYSKIENMINENSEKDESDKNNENTHNIYL